MAFALTRLLRPYEVAVWLAGKEEASREEGETPEVLCFSFAQRIDGGTSVLTSGEQVI